MNQALAALPVVLLLIPAASASPARITGPIALLGPSDFNGTALWEGAQVEPFLTSVPTGNKSVVVRYSLPEGTSGHVALVSTQSVPMRGNLSVGRLNATMDLAFDFSPESLSEAIRLNVTSALQDGALTQVGIPVRAPPLLVLIEEPDGRSSHPRFANVTKRSPFGADHAEYVSLVDLNMVLVWCAPSACRAAERASTLAAHRAAGYEFGTYRKLHQWKERLEKATDVVDQTHSTGDLEQARVTIREAHASLVSVHPWDEIQSAISLDEGIPSPFLEIVAAHRNALEGLEAQAIHRAEAQLGRLRTTVDEQAAAAQRERDDWRDLANSTMTLISILIATYAVWIMARERRDRLEAQRDNGKKKR